MSSVTISPAIDSVLPLMYSQILCKDKQQQGYKVYQLLLYHDRIELFTKQQKKSQVHALYGGSVKCTGKMSFDLVFDYSNIEQITISFKCVTFKAKHVWKETIDHHIKIQNSMSCLEAYQELRASDVWGGIDKKYQKNLMEIVNLQKQKCLLDAERDLQELIDIQHHATTGSDDGFNLSRDVSRVANTNCCCIIN